MQLIYHFYECENFPDSSLNHIFESENFRFRFSTKNSITWGASENRWKFMREVSKIVRERNGYREIFSRPHVAENSRQYLLLGAPVYSGPGGWARSARGGGGGG